MRRFRYGITLAGFLSSAFASETFASELAPILNKLIPAISESAWNNISIIVITIILSYFTLIFGELVPKRIAMKNYEKIAFRDYRYNQSLVCHNRTICKISYIFY